MSILTLNIEFHEKGIKKTMQFLSQTVVYDACRLIRDKLGLLDDNSNNYGLFRVEADNTKCVWMENGRTLEYYLIRNGDTLQYKNKIRQLRVRTLDGGAIKTISVDESQPVSQLMIIVCSKMGISNHEEYSLVRDIEFIYDCESNGNNIINNNNNYQINGKDKRFENTFMNTIGRKKERQIQQLRAKLHTDEEIQWVDQSKTLREQNISDNETLILRRKFFFSDTNVDTRDPVQLNLLYLQCRDGVLNGLHPVSRETAIKLAALQCYIEYGSFQEGFQRSIDVKDLLPKEYAKAKEHEKNIVQEYRELIYEDQAAPKKRYCELCQSLPTYGVTFFLVKEKLIGKNKLIPRLLGINKESVMRVDEKTKAVLKEWPLEQVRRWAASYKTFTLDFGDYKDGYYSVQTLDGEKICQLIGGYIDIIMKKKKVADHLGIEGDEGSTMLEDVVAPACATLIAHGEFGQGFAQDGNVALPGVLRSGTGTPLGQGVQYGAVGGQIIAQELPKGKRIRYLDSQEKSQRALIGTIEATIRAVEEAEEEIFKQIDVELPKFDDTSHHWRVKIEKEAVEDRIAAMGAATAEVVQLTAISEENDNLVGTAITTIGSNLPEMGRGIRELASLLPNENQADDLIDAARKLCGAFTNFLDKVNPEKNKKRINILSAATRVGEFSHKVINTMNKSNDEEETLYDQLNQKARNIATSANKLVLQAKAVSIDCNESSLKEQIIYSAMKTAFVTSELIACTRIVGPTINHSINQDHLIEAAHNVAQSVEQLLVDANNASKYSVSGNGEQQYIDLHAAARQVTNALDELIDHVHSNNQNHLNNHKTQQDYSYEQLVELSNCVKTSDESVRDSENVIRHSCLHIGQFENENKYNFSDQRDKLLNAARSVAQATSNMIDATKKFQNSPHETEVQIALKNSVENLEQVSTETTYDRFNYQIIQSLESTLKDTSTVATQTISAANAVKPYLQSKLITETLLIECIETSHYISNIIQLIKENQNAYLIKLDNFTNVDARKYQWRQFKTQSRLIYESSKFVHSASKLIEAVCLAVPYVNDQNTSTHLLTSSQDLSTQLAKLRVALNNAQQHNFELQLDYSEDLICELDNELIEIGILAKNNKLSISDDFTNENAYIKLDNICRLISSSITQLISSVCTNDRKNVGSAMLEAAQSLRDFVHTVHGIVSTRSNIPLDSFILNSRSVVYDYGVVFDCVCKNSSNSQLEDAANNVSSSIKKILACLPENAVIEEAIERIRVINNKNSLNSNNPLNVEDLQQFAAKLIESSSKLVVSAREVHYSKSVQIFVNNYEYFHLCVLHIIKNLITETQHQNLALESLDIAKSQALNVLDRAQAANADPNNLAHTQALSQASRSLTDTINIIIEQHYSRKKLNTNTLWSRECENALSKIQSIRYIFDKQSIYDPLNSNNYYESLTQVTNEARRLGDAMTGMAHFSRCEDKTQVCQAVNTFASSICGLVENAAQCAYLIGIEDKQNKLGKSTFFDFTIFENSLKNIKQLVENIKSCKCNKLQIIEDFANIKTHTSNLTKICQNASNLSKNLNTKRQFLTYACDITLAINVLIDCIEKTNSDNTKNNCHECLKNAHEIRVVVKNLEVFVNNLDFESDLVEDSVIDCQVQKPIILSTCQILNGSCEIISTAKNLDTHSLDESTWEQIADSSKVVSDSIIQLVAEIFKQAPGQKDLDFGLNILRGFIKQIEKTALNFSSQEKLIFSSNITEQIAHQQKILHALESLIDLIDELKIAAINHAEAISYSVQNHIKIIEDLVNLCIQAFSLSQNNSRFQKNILDHCKTIIEAEIYMFVSAKNSAGNPRAQEMHSIVEKASQQLRVAIIEFKQKNIIIDFESDVTYRIIEIISRSISLADKFCHTPSDDTFADMQTRIINTLNEVKQIETNMSSTEPKNLGLFCLQLAEHYENLVNDTRIAQNLLASSDLAQKLKLNVQKLGTGCIEVVKTACQRLQHCNDECIHNQFFNSLNNISMHINKVMDIFNEESCGTQACINAAKTVTGIIGDLDTTIMFATSGSLNSCINKNEINFETYKNNIIKAAKALIEDTKALVCGAASNQEQLAVAAQNTVRTIVHLVEAVKGGAATISADSTESQVMAIHAVRDVAAALSNLIQTTKNASGKAPTDPAIGNLKEAAKVMVTNVSSLLRLIKTTEDTSQRSTHAIEAAVNAIDVCLRQYDNSETSGHHYIATADEVINSTLSIIEAANRATSAHTSSNSEQEYQESIIGAANYSRQAVNNLLATTRAAACSVENAEVKYKILNNGREVALQVKNMLSLLLITYKKPDDRHAKNNLFIVANEISKAVNNLKLCSERLRTDLVSNECSMYNSAEPITIAENELIGVANSIEEASTKLAKLRHCQIHEQDENFTFNEQIIIAASSTAVAVQTLVKAASFAQRELVFQNRIESYSTFAADNYQWSEGLISASRLVAAAVCQLCEAANDLVQGQATEEKLISAAKQVASSTAHLLVACKVKSDINSHAMQRLQIAGHAVKTATEHLVNTARQLIVDDKRALIISDRMVTGIAQVMDAQEEVLRKERELEEARVRLAAINKSRYEKSPELI